MGETYRNMMSDLMARYEETWRIAFDEFERNGVISDETDYDLSVMESILEMVGAI